MSRASLTKFSEAILYEAAMQREELIAELEERRNKELSNIKKELSAKAKEYIDSETKRMEHESQNKISNVKNRAFQMLIETRTNMFNEIFDGVEKKIREYKESEKYLEFLRQSLDDVMSKINKGKTVCEVVKADYKFMSILSKKYADIEVVCSKNDFIGGFIIKNSDMKIYVDNTLIRQLELKKREFYKNRELIIEH